MGSLDYKLSAIEKNDLINCSIENDRVDYKIYEITNLPYGHLFHLKDKSGYGNSFVVNISDNEDNKEIDVLPQCNLAKKLQSLLKDYLQKHKEFK